MNPKIYIDCSNTYNSGLNTGIQRVVKSVINHREIVSKKLDVQIESVFFRDNAFYIFNTNIIKNKQSENKIKLKLTLKKTYKSFKNLLSTILPTFLSEKLNSATFNIFLNNLADRFLSPLKKNKEKEVEFMKNDILLLMDSMWLNNHKFLMHLKTKEVKIINVIYDFIPLTFPHFFDKHLVQSFENWYKNSVNYVDYYLAISQTVKIDSFEYMKNNFDENIKKEKFDYFYLGANLEQNANNNETIKQEYKEIFNKENTYISVSTLEPRKNHIFILESFEILWNKNIDVKLVFIGKIGWKIDNLLKKIRNHKQYNKRLFLLNSVDDHELIYAYKNSKALIFASFIEGFGLPIIESLYNNLPVIASNIPIHKEIGKNNISYFDLKDHNSLVKLIQEDSFYKDIKNFKWISWQESSTQLIKKCLSFK